MIIIYGRRSYGRVDECGGEYAQTSFAHIYYMPLVPTGSFWVTRKVGSQSMGLTIRLNVKSVAAAYLRTWAPLVALVALASSPGFVTALIAVALVALSLTSYAWATLRSEQARRRSDFNLLAFGSRCEPALVNASVRAELQAALEARWAKLDAKQPPDDVARFGAANLDEAVIAYGLLRLTGIAKRSSAEHAAADRLLAGSHEKLPVGEGPYRGGADEPREAPAIHDEAAVVAAKYTAARARAPIAPVTPWWQYRGSKPLAIAILMAISLGGIFTHLGAISGAQRVTPEDLVVQHGMVGSYIEVTCDHVSPPAEIVEGIDEHVTAHVFGCTLGNSLLAVKTSPDVALLDPHVIGKVHVQSDLALSWPTELTTFQPIFVDVHELKGERIEAVLAALVGVLAIGLALYWRRGARRRRDATVAV